MCLPSCRLAPRSGCHLLLRGLWRISEADCHAIVRVHQADRDGEIDELALLEDGAGSLVSLIRDAGFSHTGHRFGPCEGGTLPRVEEMTGFGPGLHQRDLFDLLSALQQIARVYVEEVGAAVDLRNAQIDQSDKRCRKIALHEITVDAAKRFHPCGCDAVVIETLSHFQTP